MSWFPPPERLSSQVFSSLPNEFRTKRMTPWADANKAGQAIDSFLEGPSFDSAGNLYITDIPHGRVFRIARDGTWTLIATYDGWPNGLKIASDGTAYITDYKCGLMRLDPTSGSVTSHYSHVRSESFKGLNDLIIAANGDIYFTDQGQTGMQDPSGRVYRLTNDGRIERLIDTAPSPNGIALSRDQKWLFVAMTRACQIWRMPVSRDGIVGKANVFAHTPGGTSGPDGVAVDSEDGLVFANPGHGCVWRVDRHGVPTHKIESCAGRTITNIAFDPLNPSRLVFTDSDTGQVLEAQLPIPGHLLSGHST
ncbi:MAG: SMP-30/gluconolactonase/LRE family protein [Hyphomicrobiales bacterium]|nr:MAG: SMP-30/gluconolactonase/LRE family protein [Hyphomicrobiales bacterium]